MCLGGATLPVYKGVEEGEGVATLGAPQEESYSHRELPPFHVGVGEEREAERGRKERGALPPFLVQFVLGRGGAVPLYGVP